MDILGDIGSFVFNQTVGLGVGMLLGAVVTPAAKKAVVAIIRSTESPLSSWVVWAFGGEKELARFAVEYVERKLPDSVGEKKKAAATAIIRKYLPALPDSFISELVEVSVSQMNSSLKSVAKNIK